MKDFGNDTLAIILIGTITIVGLITGDATTVAAGVGGLVGYIGGSKLSR
jgi:hypothetical protein